MINAIFMKMTDFYEGNLHDIEHFIKVHAYARTIALGEKLSPPLQTIVEISALVHDIACPLCRQKYGSADGKKQELESPDLLKTFLKEFHLDPDMESRIIYLVSHHHTVLEAAETDHRILLEADFLVNASEGSASREAIRNFRDKVALTATGKQLFDSIYLR